MTQGLTVLAQEAAGCTKCRLSESRTQVVFGNGDPNADLMFVGEAPGYHEDQQGYPFVGQAGKLLDKLLAGIGLERSDVYVVNTLKCLRYDAPVQLGDGSWERIGRLVRTGYTGEVMSVDGDGSLVPKRVTGWHATPLAGRRVYKVTYRSAKGTSQGGRVSAQMTGDHPVLTERGYVAVEALLPGDRIATGQGMSTVAFDVVCGTLLGDGSLARKSASLTIAHSAKQADYALFKRALLEEFDASVAEMSVAAVVGGDPVYPVVHVRTRAHRALGILRTDFYEDRKVVPAWIEDRLNARMLAIWFMDDGYTRLRPGRSPLAEIATVGFADEDIQVLLRGLGRLGLHAKSSRGRIYFDVSSTQWLSRLIAPFVPQSMRYKLDPEVEREIPFDQTAFERGDPVVLYEDVDVEDVTDWARTDTTFFCVDVEDTHNFVTAGGVVHNCRPPGNRDPQPDEKQACEPWLFKQIELIRPKVIATLGNHATKQLTGKETGITRIHGQEQRVRYGSVDLILYPLYHPAAALYTPAMLKVLEEDFRRLPELIGRELLAEAEPEPELEPMLAGVAAEPAVQLGLF